jgi:hypothetical protein
MVASATLRLNHKAAKASVSIATAFFTFILSAPSNLGRHKHCDDTLCTLEHVNSLEGSDEAMS